MDTADRLPPAALAFLRDLAAHNDKKWYEANRARCEEDLLVPAGAPGAAGGTGWDRRR